MNASEAGGGLALMQTSLLSSFNTNWLAFEQLDLQNKISEVCIKTRSPAASLLLRGQVYSPSGHDVFPIKVKMVIARMDTPKYGEILRDTKTGTSR